MQDPSALDIYSVVKDLGGWAIVIWIVRWLTGKWEQSMTTMSSSITEIVKVIAEIKPVTYQNNRLLEKVHEKLDLIDKKSI